MRQVFAQNVKRKERQGSYTQKASHALCVLWKSKTNNRLSVLMKIEPIKALAKWAHDAQKRGSTVIISHPRRAGKKTFKEIFDKELKRLK